LTSDENADRGSCFLNADGAAFSPRPISARQTSPAFMEMIMLRKLLRMLFGHRAHTALAYVPIRPIPPARIRRHARGGLAMSP